MDIHKQLNQGMTQINEPSDISESIKELNYDAVDKETRMTPMDMKARLSFFELNSCLALDSLVGMKILPTKCAFLTRQKKRLSVSLDGQGRKEIVQLAVGNREQEEVKNVSALQKFFGVKDKNVQTQQ